ncbi:AAA-like domain-containing protein [Oxynema sp. CENA135]|uniref:AAA-like domain-containing protein n=1 Tax=Oxynema sp. CENA135 TaxID=984206 RepID=UPI00190DE19F|nr:AAA-like domain-containing protein [Oxynema sp. CENA135]MBK4731844.1 AAA-like domain-containing protein [Oxynema sp. CENA135]
MSLSSYQVGGSLSLNNPTYIERKADRQLYEALKNGEFCYVLNSRQMGKSSLLVRTRHRLQAEGFQCTTLDMTRIGSENIEPLQWYKGIVTELWQGFGLFGKFNLKHWWRDENEISLLQRLSKFIEEILLEKLPDRHLVIFIDEIDSILTLPFSIDDFFALIRFCYNQRAIHPEYQRITFAIFGVATPSDLIRDRHRTPFNIGRAIELRGFDLSEVDPLIRGFEGRVKHPRRLIEQILKWTGGQPFLTQKLCKLLLQLLADRPRNSDSENGQMKMFPGTESFWVEDVVRSHIVDNWQSQDEPEHLRTIRDRLLRNPKRAGRLLGIYQQILRGVEIVSDDSSEQIELFLSGLIEKKENLLVIRNRIYRGVFCLEWVARKLQDLRPYSQALDAWIESGQTDESRLLRGQALFDAQTWSQGKSLSDIDYQFLAKSQNLDRREMHQVFELERGKAIAKEAKLQRRFLRVVTAALVISMGLGLSTFWQYQTAIARQKQASISEIKALVSSSQGLFASEQKLDALVQALKADFRKKQLHWKDRQVQRQIDSVLRQAVYGAIEYNRLNHTSPVMDSSISPDGQFITSVNREGRLKLWTIDGVLSKIIDESLTTKTAVVFSPDRKKIAVGDSQGAIQLWSANGVKLREFTGHEATIASLRFSPDSQYLLSASRDRTAKLWTIRGELVQTFNGHDNEVLIAVFHPDGQSIATGSLDSTVKLWKRDGTLIKTFAQINGPVSGIAFSPDEKAIAIGTWNDKIFVYEENATEATELLGHTNSILTVTFSPDGETIASGGDDNTVRLWSREGALIDTFEGHTDPVVKVEFTPDGQQLLSASLDGTIRFWRFTHPLLTVLNKHSNFVLGAGFNVATGEIVTGSGDDYLYFWNREGKLLRKSNDPPGGWMRLHPKTGDIMNVNVIESKINLTKADGTPISTLVGHQDYIWAIAFSPNDDRLGSFENINRRIILWKRNGSMVKNWIAHDDVIGGIDLSSDRRLASGDWGGVVKIWNRDGEFLQSFQAHSDRIIRVTFSPNGESLATASADGTVKLWDVRGKVEPSRHVLTTLKGHVSWVYDVQFSPDGQRIATAGRDRTVKVWNRSGELLVSFSRHQKLVWCINFSPDGKFLISASRDRQAIVWNLDEAIAIDRVRSAGCDWIGDYLKTNRDIEEGDRGLCDG